MDPPSETSEALDQDIESFSHSIEVEHVEDINDARKSASPSPSPIEPQKDPSQDRNTPNPPDAHEPKHNNATTSPTRPAPPVMAALTALIESDRFPPGQEAIFKALDALTPQLSMQDTLAGLRNAHEWLRATLQVALRRPSRIMARKDVRAKLQAEYDDLPSQQMLDDIVKTRVLEGIKDMVGQRWRIEAMALQGYEVWPRLPLGFGS